MDKRSLIRKLVNSFVPEVYFMSSRGDEHLALLVELAVGEDMDVSFLIKNYQFNLSAFNECYQMMAYRGLALWVFRFDQTVEEMFTKLNLLSPEQQTRVVNVMFQSDFCETILTSTIDSLPTKIKLLENVWNPKVTLSNIVASCSDKNLLLEIFTTFGFNKGALGAPVLLDVADQVWLADRICERDSKVNDAAVVLAHWFESFKVAVSPSVSETVKVLVQNMGVSKFVDMVTVSDFLSTWVRGNIVVDDEVVLEKIREETSRRITEDSRVFSNYVTCLLVSAKFLDPHLVGVGVMVKHLELLPPSVVLDLLEPNFGLQGLSNRVELLSQSGNARLPGLVSRTMCE